MHLYCVFYLCFRVMQVCSTKPKWGADDAMSISAPLKLGGTQNAKPVSSAATWKLLADDMDEDDLVDDDNLADEVSSPQKHRILSIH
jgi:hypothetical protein